MDWKGIDEIIDNKNDIIHSLRKIDNVRWEMIPLPLFTNSEYYISENATICSVTSHLNRYFLKIKNDYKKNKKNIAVRFSNGAHKNKEFCTHLDKCVYNAFISMVWISDIEIEHLDGDIYNCKLHNIRKKELIDVSIMYEFSELYKQQFDVQVRKVSFFHQLSIDDSKDIVQTAFIEVSLSNQNTDYFMKAWIETIKRRTYDYFNNPRKRLMYSFNLIDEFAGKNDKEFELPVFRFLKRPSERVAIKYLIEGYHRNDIAEFMNITPSSASSHITRGTQFLQKLLANE